MRERPILFSAPMVRAILDDSKTQTRRLVKTSHAGYRCPFGGPGDHLCVRESFLFTSDFDEDSPARVGERCLDAGYRTARAPIQCGADVAKRDWVWVVEFQPVNGVT
ncbi:hypothetical protein [Paraburkholderia sp. J12]|uniref:hypothetical protein n=1 Tax=Paraburkholderia sp. J12 TaxID=2805432 RepID=UPI002ABDBF67|nr:hypothetical protein [Paraburkholderia sp. J12]